MDDLDNLKPSAAVKSSFEPIMKAIGAVRAQLADVKDVVAVRPGYKYPPAGKPRRRSSSPPRRALRQCRQPSWNRNSASPLR
jgi:hypothetical protein